MRSVESSEYSAATSNAFESNSKLSLRSMFRCLSLAPVLLWFFALDHFWILVDKRKQAWHDKMSGFFVIKRGAQSIGQCQMIQRVIGFMLLTFTVWEPLAEEW